MTTDRAPILALAPWSLAALRRPVTLRIRCKVDTRAPAESIHPAVADLHRRELRNPSRKRIPGGRDFETGQAELKALAERSPAV